jgi:hypothetical protein
MNVESIDGYLHALTGIDDYSGYSWTVPLTKKSEAFEAAVSIIRAIERQTSHLVAVVRTDGGGEFQRLTPYCNGNGMTHQITAPHDHKANGKVEKLNRDVVANARCLLADSQLGPEWWAHALDTANYLRNRVVGSQAIATPYELLFDVRPDVSHFKVFGSTCTAFLPKPVRDGKFDFVSVPGIFVGYMGSGYLVLTDKDDGRIGHYSKIECYEVRKPKADWQFFDPFSSLYEQPGESVSKQGVFS